MARAVSADMQAKMEEFGLAIEEPDEPDVSRKSKNYDKFIAACEIAITIADNKVNEVCLGEFDNSTQPYGLAKAINNDERPEFVDWEGGYFTAHSHRVEGGKYKIWIKFNKGEKPTS